MTWLIVAGLFLVAWFWQNVSHELSHLYNGWLWEGIKPLKLIPWPHKHEGRFYFARYEGGIATRSGSEEHRHIAPLWWAINQQVLFLAVIAVDVFLNSAEHWIYFFPFFVCPSVDSLVWIWGALLMRPGTDGMRYRTVKNFHKEV